MVVLDSVVSAGVVSGVGVVIVGVVDGVEVDVVDVVEGTVRMANFKYFKMFLFMRESRCTLKTKIFQRSLELLNFYLQSFLLHSVVPYF